MTRHASRAVALAAARAEHLANCAGCDTCQGHPPPETKLEQRLLPALFAEMFGPAGADRPPFVPSPALVLLQQMAAAERARSRARAKPGQSRKAPNATRAELEKFLANHITEFGKERGWVKAAMNFYRIDAKTIWNRMQDE